MGHPAFLVAPPSKAAISYLFALAASTEVDGMLAEPMRVTRGADLAYCSASDSGGELARFPGDTGGKAHNAPHYTHGSDGGGIWFSTLGQQTAERTESRTHYGWCPGVTRGTPKDFAHVLTVED
jgi:hypothetical protein